MKKRHFLPLRRLLITGMLNRRLLFKTNRAEKRTKKPSPIISVSELGRRKLSMQPKICGGAENVVKTETQQTFVNTAWFYYYFQHLYPLEARVLLTIIA